MQRSIKQASARELVRTDTETTSKPKIRNEFKNLPIDIGIKLTEFMEGLHHTNYLRPIAAPKPEWKKIFFGNSWDVAWDLAFEAAFTDGSSMSVDYELNLMKEAIGTALSKSNRLRYRALIRSTVHEILEPLFKKAAPHDTKTNVNSDILKTAVSDVSLIAELILLEDKARLKAELAYMEKRVEVWRMGYGVFCDVNGVLYIYAMHEFDGKIINITDVHRK